ncbi:unnamed protein product [Acanthosepion pharaonis]|uniref:Uncharacterized protein n=1 Tax=Acanthosepion pharaonis TaxID=158019 RepID=A0A812CQD2_ACAPH|nr:unnamed protein product [Sepia pharaonis]
MSDILLPTVKAAKALGVLTSKSCRLQLPYMHCSCTSMQAIWEAFSSDYSPVERYPPSKAKVPPSELLACGAAGKLAIVCLSRNTAPQPQLTAQGGITEERQPVVLVGGLKRKGESQGGNSDYTAACPGKKGTANMHQEQQPKHQQSKQQQPRQKLAKEQQQPEMQRQPQKQQGKQPDHPSEKLQQQTQLEQPMQQTEQLSSIKIISSRQSSNNSYRSWTSPWRAPSSPSSYPTLVKKYMRENERRKLFPRLEGVCTIDSQFLERNLSSQKKNLFMYFRRWKIHGRPRNFTLVRNS